MPDSSSPIEAYVDASAALLAMPLAGELRERVVAALTRIADFAGDVAGAEIPLDTEIAGVFVP